MSILKRSSGKMNEKDKLVGIARFTDNQVQRKCRVPKIENITDTEKEEYVTEQQHIAKMMQEFPRTLPNALDVVMREYYIRENELAEDSNLDIKTIVRMRTNINYKPKLTTMIQLCIGLRVPAVICLALLEVSGFTLKFYGIEFAYYCIITQKMGCTLEICNKFLKGMGYPALGKSDNIA